MWHEAGWRSREIRNRTAAWTAAVCSTSVPLWSPSERIRTPCICLQKGRLQINSAPCSKRAGSSCSLGSSNSQHEGTAGFMSFWREKARWSYFGSVAERWISCLGRHSCLSFGRLLCCLGCQRTISEAELAANKKEDKYSGLAADYLFQPIAVETLGPINESASDFFSLMAKKINHHSGDEREFFSSAIQRRATIHDSFVFEDCPE